MKVAVIGATGLVGQKMLNILKERNFPFDEIVLAASERSVGKKIAYKNMLLTIVSVEDAIESCPDIALFSAGSDVSLKYAPLFAAKGTYVIDNSSAWRKDPSIPLVVPEINGNLIDYEHHIIANPNCSTIGLAVILAPLHKKYGVKRVIVSTYQAVSGCGQKGLNQLRTEQRGWKSPDPVFPHQIVENVIPQGGTFLENGYTTEEEKLLFETNKILGSSFGVSATVVRVPVLYSHSESVNVEFENPYDLDELRDYLKSFSHIVVQDDTSKNEYPMPVKVEAYDEVFVGRLRRDFTIANGLNFWVVSDNVRKGAATNAVQIAELMLKFINKK